MVISSPCIDLATMPFELDSGNGTRANIGLIVLSTDSTLEREFSSLIDQPDIEIFATRIESDSNISVETLRLMEARIPNCVNVLPTGLDFDVIAYGCTSATMMFGEDTVARQIHSARPNCQVTDPVTAMRAAFGRLGITRIGLLTPYSEEVNDRMRLGFVERGLEISIMSSFHEPNDNRVALISEKSTLDAIVEIGNRPECDAVFVSCTTLRSLSVLEEAEAIIQKPVSSSNHALAWHTLHLTGQLQDAPRKSGRLFQIA